MIVRAVLGKQSLEWLSDHRIFLHRRGLWRLKPGDILEFADTAELEPHVGFYKGNALCSCGTMSFSNSVVLPKIAIGRYCSIAPEVETLLTSHPTSHLSTSGFTHDPHSHITRSFAADHGFEAPRFSFETRPPPVIGDDVWLGGRSAILPGVTLGSGAVVAAGSVVTRSVGPYEVVGGNPARVLKKRFSDRIIEGLLQSEWWAYRPADLAGLPLNDAARFLEAFMPRKPDLERYDPPRARMVEMPRDG